MKSMKRGRKNSGGEKTVVSIKGLSEEDKRNTRISERQKPFRGLSICTGLFL